MLRSREPGSFGRTTYHRSPRTIFTNSTKHTAQQHPNGHRTAENTHEEPHSWR